MKSEETINLHELENGSPFKFNGDKTRTTYWFKKMDGMYGQVFSSEKDMKEFNKPAFVGASSLVERIKV